MKILTGCLLPAGILLAAISGQAAAGTSESGAAPSAVGISGVDISFDYKRISGWASNQMALWVEDRSGNAVRTLYVSDFTGARRGYEKRPDSLKSWAAAAKPRNMTDESIDAVSGATPSDGRQAFFWDLTDDSGAAIPAGTYRICLEGTLRWSSSVMFCSEIDLNAARPGALPVSEKRSEPSNDDGSDMLGNVAMIARKAQ